jgi:TnpA family transposase
MGNHGVSYAKEQYVRRRFVAKEALRQAISRVVDATLAIRQPAIWGEATTWCASDAKLFAAWNQNLLTQWHKRYHSRGHGVLARGQTGAVHLLTAQSALFFRGGRHD